MANITPFGLRMQPDLKGRLEMAARSNGRSLNAEIVGRLETYDAIFDRARELVRERDQLAEELAAAGKVGRSERFNKLLAQIAEILQRPELPGSAQQKVGAPTVSDTPMSVELFDKLNEVVSRLDRIERKVAGDSE